MPVSREDVVMAYRYILGREPENEAVIAAHMAGNEDRHAMRMTFLQASETLEIVNARALPPSLPLDVPALPIQLTADAETMASLISYTGKYWEEVGRTAPHWSVLTAPEYRPEHIDANEVAFFESGRDDAALLVALLRRIGRAPEEFQRCAEYSCGVGRITTHLAKLFPQVQALDISRPHLELARQTLARFGQTNLEFHQVTPADLHPAQGFDLWFTRIVLQHNPPPIIMAILDKVFGLLAPGGVAVFQVPTYRVRYSFEIGAYMQQGPGERMEVHVVPQKAVLDLAARHGLQLADMREDTPVVENSPNWLSNTFVFCKG